MNTAPLVPVAGSAWSSGTPYRAAILSRSRASAGGLEKSSIRSTEGSETIASRGTSETPDMQSTNRAPANRVLAKCRYSNVGKAVSVTDPALLAQLRDHRHHGDEALAQLPAVGVLLLGV